MYQKTEAELAKSYFLARMSHEMRTPLNAIIGMSTIAQSTIDLERISECLVKIDEASLHLLGMINDALDLAKIESGNMKLSCAEFNFPQMLKKIVNMSKFTLNAKKQKLVRDFDPGLPETIVSDEQRFIQLMDKLLSNAVKFTPPGNTITLAVKKLKEDEESCSLKIEVRDTGIGITAGGLETIFSLFEQADGSLSRKFDGTGMGLRIFSSIVHLMGGKIDVESEPGKGTCFCFEVTVKKGARKTETPTGETGDQRLFPGKTIILAEDVEINREIVISLIEDTKVTIDCAENGLEALEKYKADPEKYSLIFMDIHMPVMDGIEAAKQIRLFEKDQNLKQIPIVAMTANIFKEDVDKCLLAGMNDHLGKPIDSEDLMKQLDKFCRINFFTEERTGSLCKNAT